MKRIAIFASGNGSNAENIIRYFQTNDLGVEVALVISNRHDAFVLQRAEKLKIPHCILTRAQLNDADTTIALMEQYAIDFIVLAGFLLMIPSFLIQRFSGRIVNIHPSLLPKYGGKGMYGNHVHEAVVAAGEKETGITIHAVNEQCDGGDILFQAVTTIEPTDTADDVANKVHQLEYTHFPRIIAQTILSNSKQYNG